MGAARELPGFDRRFLESKEAVTRIGAGALGGKAQGLLAARDVLAARFAGPRIPKIAIDVPRLAVLATGVFEAFVERNRLGGPERVIDLVEARAPHGFENVEAVASYEERRAIVSGYAAVQVQGP